MISAFPPSSVSASATCRLVASKTVVLSLVPDHKPCATAYEPAATRELEVDRGIDNRVFEPGRGCRAFALGDDWRMRGSVRRRRRSRFGRTDRLTRASRFRFTFRLLRSETDMRMHTPVRRRPQTAPIPRPT